MPGKMIYSQSGLCNRLRLMSLWRSTGSITVIWTKNAACPAWWRELFHDLDGVDVRDTNHTKMVPTKWPENHRRSFSINDLTPIFEVPKIANSYVAVHVRRTDIERVQKKRRIIPQSDQSYFDFIDNSGEDWVYLATDNQKTQGAFRRRYGDRLLCYEEIHGYGSRHRPARCTSMVHAVVDLFTCAKASSFLGTLGSSFTGEIMGARPCP